MIRKLIAGFIALALHAAAVAPIASADMSAVADPGMIEIIRSEESEVPGYYHTKYVFWHPSCQTSMPVDHYGAAIDANDAEMLKQELKYCKEKPDGESDSED
jgi:hypothetical protein